MSDDLDYLRARIPDYREYSEEAARHDSDMRIRAFAGERLTEARTRLDVEADGSLKESVDAVLMRCMFTDQVFIHNFEHADLQPAMIAALVRADRSLVTLAERLSTVSIAELPQLLHEIDEQFDYRRAPVPIAM
ncbi:MAG: hypothetical protein IAI50_03265 [Candidatus Eremiobacteraeota bacterium]|nr:hypothetical protein [Candidatus Eremiobacteraeota bacterium]